MEVLVKYMHYIQYDCKQVCLLYQSQKTKQRKAIPLKKWLSGLRYSGSFLKISLHVQYSKKKNSDWKKKLNYESRLCYKVHIFLEEF